MAPGNPARPGWMATATAMALALVLPMMSGVAAADTTVVAGARLPSPRYDPSAIWDGRHAYVFGGYGFALRIDEIARYDPALDRVEVMQARLPTPRIGMASLWDGRHAYLLGGSDSSSALAQIVRYDPATDSRAIVAAELPYEVTDAAGVWHDGAGYVIGGQIRATPPYTPRVVRFDPAAGTATLTGMVLPTPLANAAAASDGRAIYVFGGSIDAEPYSTDQIVRLDPAGGTATLLAKRLPSPLHAASAVWSPEPRPEVGCPAGCIYVFGGQGRTGYLDDILAFNPDAGTLQPVGKLRGVREGARAHMGAVWADDRALLLGGAGQGTTGNFLEEILRYGPFNLPPEARIAPVPPQECVQGGARVTLDGTASRDPEGQPITFAWTAPGITFDDPAAPKPTATFPLGTTTVTLAVSDGKRTGTATASVLVRDTLPPMLTLPRPARGALYAHDTEVRAGLPGDAVALGGVTVVADATDQCGIARVDFRANDGTQGTATQGPYTFFADPLPGTSTTTTVDATAHDLGGNTRTGTLRFTQVRTNACPLVLSQAVCATVANPPLPPLPPLPALPSLQATCREALSEALCAALPPA